VTHDVLTPPAPHVSRVRLWTTILLPLVLLAAVVALIVTASCSNRTASSSTYSTAVPKP
jgi:membrane protein YdbS with pleckstrin-like domain